MAANFLTPQSVDLKNSDSLSEISENGTVNSEWSSGWGSRDDLRDLATKIGLEDTSELHQQRFRVDRKKLENMLLGNSEAPEPADTFFCKIMEDTNTFIKWPSKLKIGSKTKKDPRVQISGRLEDVEIARDRVMDLLEIRNNRVTMKMDVSYTDHSHIIGKDGLTIKRVIKETRCHVHFPDSNRSNPTEKSNLVSIAGDLEDAERARSRVRNLTPIIFSFELPVVNSNTLTAPNSSSPYVLKIQQQYNVQVMFRTRPQLHATLVMVKGSEWEIQQLKQATCLLMEYMCDNLSNQIPIQMSMEISPHYHPIVTGQNYENVKAITQNTRTQIMFPDAQDPNIPNLKKSNVIITGNIHNVYIARQQLMGSLPLVLIFDFYKESTYALQPDQLINIETLLDVTIIIRHKAKQNLVTCIIKGLERCASNIYEARNRVLGISEPNIVADIPPSYFIPASVGNCEVPPAVNVQPASPLLGFPLWQHHNQASFVDMVQQPQFMYYNMIHTSYRLSGYNSMGQLSSSYVSLEHSREGNSYSSISTSSPSQSPLASLRNIGSPVFQSLNSNESPSSDGSKCSLNYYQGRRSDIRQSFTISDYDQKRITGIMAMQNRQIGGFRVPTNTWSGYGISHTSPGALQRVDKKENVWKQEDESLPSVSILNRSNVLDSAPASVINQITNSTWTDLSTMLTYLGLDKYIGIFTSYEIDLITFPSLSEHDLIELGVTAFGARRKMLLIISELNKRANPFPAAPVAERKSGSSLTYINSSPQSNW